MKNALKPAGVSAGSFPETKNPPALTPAHFRRPKTRRRSRRLISGDQKPAGVNADAFPETKTRRNTLRFISGDQNSAATRCGAILSLKTPPPIARNETILQHSGDCLRYRHWQERSNLPCRCVRSRSFIPPGNEAISFVKSV